MSLIGSIFNFLGDMIDFIESNLVASTLCYITIIWLLYLIRKVSIAQIYKARPSEKIDKLDFIQSNPEKKWLFDLNQKEPDLAQYYWYWQQENLTSRKYNQNSQHNYTANNKSIIKEIKKAIVAYNDYMNSEVDPKIIATYNESVQDIIKKYQSKNGSNTGNFRSAEDIFLTYLNNKTANREDGWIEKSFAKDIWKSFDKKIREAESKIDQSAIAYLSNLGIKIPIFDGKPEQSIYFNHLVSVLRKYKNL